MFPFLRLILIANDSNKDYGGITDQQEKYTSFNEICGTNYGLEKQFSYESYALDKLRFAGDYGSNQNRGVLFGCFNQSSQ